MFNKFDIKKKRKYYKNGYEIFYSYIKKNRK